MERNTEVTMEQQEYTQDQIDELLYEEEQKIREMMQEYCVEWYNMINR
jgi:hypothetical protein